MKTIILRDNLLADRSLGEMYIDDAPFCLTLEDAARAFGIKIPGETCIPECTANLTVSMSNRFKRMMVMASTEANGYELKAGGISFKGIRFHGGNNPEHTAGCPLLAYFPGANNTIYGTAEVEFTKLVSDALYRGEEVTCEWINVTG